MADDIPPHDPDVEPPPQPEPPPLDSIRVTGAGAKGLNKPAILGAAGLGAGIVLVMASGAFTNDPARKHAEIKPIMSDPARPEMAKGAIRELPADYTQIAAPTIPSEPTPPPRLGPPLSGDIAAFAETEPELGSYSSVDAGVWDDAESVGAPVPADSVESETHDADRSGIFFALRQETGNDAPDPQPPTTVQLPSPRLTAFAPSPLQPAAPDRTAERALFPGAVIPASLVTEVNSESPGPVIGQITQAIYDSATGRTLLIPQGARLIGEYRSSTRYGQGRVGIAWSRLIMPDGREIALTETALDPAGAAGVAGDVENHWGDVLGAAALGTLINVGVATTENPVAYGAGFAIRDPVDAAVSDGVQRMASNVTNRVVDRGLAIPPTIRIPAGAKLSVIVTQRVTL